MAKKDVKKFRSAKMVVGEARASYAYVFYPRTGDDGKPSSYGITLMFPKNGNAFVQKSIKSIQAAVDAAFDDLVAQKAITAKQAEAMKENPKECAWKDGDADWNCIDGVYDHEEYKGHYILVCSNKLKDSKGELIPPAVYYPPKDGGGVISNSSDFVSGDYCMSEIVIATYSELGLGVTAFFNSVKKTRSGEPFSASAPRESAYDDYLEEFPDEDEASNTGATGKSDDKDEDFN